MQFYPKERFYIGLANLAVSFLSFSFSASRVDSRSKASLCFICSNFKARFWNVNEAVKNVMNHFWLQMH